MGGNWGSRTIQITNCLAKRCQVCHPSWYLCIFTVLLTITIMEDVHLCMRLNTIIWTWNHNGGPHALGSHDLQGQTPPQDLPDHYQLHGRPKLHLHLESWPPNPSQVQRKD